MKILVIVIQILIKWPLQKFPRGTAAVLSWHAQNFVVIWSPVIEIQLKKISIELELWWKNHLWDGSLFNIGWHCGSLLIHRQAIFFLNQWRSISNIVSYHYSAVSFDLTQWRRICITALGNHWFRPWLVAYLLPGYFLNQWWFICPVSSFRDRLRLNLNKNTSLCYWKDYIWKWLVPSNYQNQWWRVS